ncbi:hypothetical protein RNH32_005499, partial [Escherichia coli]|nr:hypothetical protein [Escherichia coli]
PDVVFIDVAKHSVTLRDMADRAGCPVDNFPCVFVDDVYLEPLPPEPGKPHFTYC